MNDLITQSELEADIDEMLLSTTLSQSEMESLYILMMREQAERYDDEFCMNYGEMV